MIKKRLLQPVVLDYKRTDSDVKCFARKMYVCVNETSKKGSACVRFNLSAEDRVTWVRFSSFL